MGTNEEAPNFKRGDRAEKAMKAAGYAPEAVGDLISDALHFARRDDQADKTDIAELLGNSLAQYGADCVEQAWENSDDWNEELQAPENASRALMVLIACGVPAEFHYHTLVLLGIAAGDA